MLKTTLQRPAYDKLYWHTGYLWDDPDRVPYATLRALLAAKDQLIVLRHGRPPYQVVLGVPHHVPGGTRRICEHRYDAYGNVNDRKGDDNVASFALVAFSRLTVNSIPSKLVIMAHATTHDPNKMLNSPYCREIFQDEMRLLFECHASSGRRLLDLELSAGSNPLTQTMRFGQMLVSALDQRYVLGVQTVSRSSRALIFQPGGMPVEGTLQLPATKTTSLSEAGNRGIEALHLEAKPAFRVNKAALNAVSPHGLRLGRAIAETIVQYAGSPFHCRSGPQ